MSSRKEQKEALRREREEREAAAKAAQRRRQLIGYGAGGALVVAVVAVLVVLLASGGGEGGGEGQASAGSNVLPDGGSVPEPPAEDPELEAAVEAAGGELETVEGTSREHVDESQAVEYESSPPTSGAHDPVAAEDGDYEQAPTVKQTVHALEHGRIVIWFKQGLPEEARASLKALYDEDTYQMLLVPDTTDMPYDVAATAWNRDPQPNGTGRLLGFPEYNEEIFDAIRAFKDEHRSNGPEAIP